jgi:peptidyl-prolyl cis-trans isomerase SurA
MKKTAKRFQITGFLVFLLLASISAENCSRASKTLAEIGDEKITLGEFEKQYLKTIGNVDSARSKSTEDKMQFLNLYINFRLKVKDARERGLLNTPDMQKEIEEYKRSFAPTYLIDMEVVEPELKKLYERKKEEVRASHILINLPEKSTLQDSILAYQKADTVIRKLENGESFESLALQYSQDRTVNQNKGDLYYFTAGMTVDEFEDAVYDLKVGEFTKKPIRTMFGLHIVKLTDRKPRLESIRASHILIQDKRDSLGKVIDSVQTSQLALDIFNRVKKGEDFTTLAAQYSEDPATKNNGGDLGYFDRRRMTQPFDSAVFAIKVGDVAGPVRTQYGWHIIKKTDEKAIEPFDKVKETLKNDFKRTQKFKTDYNKYLNTLKEKYDFKITDDGMNFLHSKFDSAKTIADYNLDSLFSQPDKERVIAAFDGGQIKMQDILNLLNVNRDYQRTPLTTATINSIITTAAESPLLNKKATDMKVEKDDEFISALRDYENGLLVFRVDQDELWSKVKLTDTDLQSYYESNKTKYTKLDSAGQSTLKTFEEVKPEISNELQQVKYKEIEKAYVDSLKQKYPVKINQEVLQDAFKE